MSRMTTKAKTRSEEIAGAMAGRPLAQFDPERVMPVSYRATGNGTWYNVDLLVVKSGVTDLRETTVAMRQAPGRMGMAKDICVNTPEGLAIACRTPGQIESIAAREGRAARRCRISP